MNLLILLSCQQALRRMDDYIDREASPSQARWVRAHLAICHACAERFAFEEQFTAAMRASLNRASQASQAQSRSSEPDEMASRIFRALRDSRGPSAFEHSEPGAEPAP